MKNKLLLIIEKIPFINSVIKGILKMLFPGSKEYWERRYAKGRGSGEGSYGKYASFKAEVINSFVRNNRVKSVVEFGCGDSNQLSLYDFPSYIGLDVSKTAIELCTKRFENDKTKSFYIYESDLYEQDHSGIKVDLALSIEVIFHLVEDDIFESYMKHLFSSSDKFVIIYSSDIDTDQNYHEKHRNFSKWIETNLPDWTKIKNIYHKESASDFFIYKKKKE